MAGMVRTETKRKQKESQADDPINKRRKICKCGSSSHLQTTHRDCPLKKNSPTTVPAAQMAPLTITPVHSSIITPMVASKPPAAPHQMVSSKPPTAPQEMVPSEPPTTNQRMAKPSLPTVPPLSTISSTTANQRMAKPSLPTAPPLSTISSTTANQRMVKP